MQPGDSVSPNPSEPQESATDQPAAQEAKWSFSEEAETTDPSSGPNFSDIETVSWTASEYVSHQKDAGWFMGLAAITAIAAVLTYFITRDVISPIFILITGFTFGVFAARPPEVLPYTVNEHGIQIGNKLYTYDTIKSFSVMEEGAFNSILLMPLKRFMPPISVYFSPEDEDKILSTIGSYLPQEKREHDLIDRLMRKIRF